MTRPAFSLPANTTIASALRQLPLDALENRILLMHALGLSRVELITQSERVISDDEAQRLSALIERRLAGEPIAYIVGEREFFGLALHVTPDVLIPRPDTELLVELALDRLPHGGRVVDLGTGSGAIAVAVAHQRPDAEVHAVDISAAALAVAGRNAERHAVRLHLHQGDWLSPLSGEPFDLVVSNPPYIRSDDPHLAQGDLRFEPIGALTDHGGGLSALRNIATSAMHHLKPGSWLLMEHGYDQASDVRRMLAGSGYTAVQSWHDLAGIERVTGGRLSR
ncbi:MAG TPA: peptide chain release factor N(5)-glutamine methyltransferase [Noviherbaspirillum sp.]|nr:peptide chain release factor N(5)-glutamine methyltransferase [Noviherbaspirillum sp.]